MQVSNEENLSDEIRSHKTRIERDLWSPSTCTCRVDVFRRLLDDWIELKGGDKAEDMQLLSPPSKGRIRSKSTHNDRSMVLTKFDKDWENYDTNAESAEDSFENTVDGGASGKRSTKRRISSKRVKISAEPIVIGEDGHRKDEIEAEQTGRKTSRKNILKNRPLLKRQSAELNEDLSPKEVNTEDKLKESSEGHTEKHHAFDWQRFNHVKKRDASKTSKTLKRGRWRRDNSYKYREKMKHQISFNENEEEHEKQNDESQECKEDNEYTENEDEDNEDKNLREEAAKTKCVMLGQEGEVIDQSTAEDRGHRLDSNFFREEGAYATYVVENTGQDKKRLEYTETSQGFVLEQPAKQHFMVDDEDYNFKERSEESLKNFTLLDAKDGESSLKEDAFREHEYSHFDLDLDAHHLIVLNSKHLESSLNDEQKPALLSASSDGPFIGESSCEGDTSIAEDAMISFGEREANTGKVRIGNGVPTKETESLEVAMTFGLE